MNLLRLQVWWARISAPIPRLDPARLVSTPTPMQAARAGDQCPEGLAEQHRLQGIVAAQRMAFGRLAQRFVRVPGGYQAWIGEADWDRLTADVGEPPA